MAALSTPGYDTKTCPITNYVWVVQFPNDTQYGVYSGKAVQFTVPFKTSLKVMLIVTAPDVANPANTAYSNTSATLVSLNSNCSLTNNTDGKHRRFH